MPTSTPRSRRAKLRWAIAPLLVGPVVLPLVWTLGAVRWDNLTIGAAIRQETAVFVNGGPHLLLWWTMPYVIVPLSVRPIWRRATVSQIAAVACAGFMGALIVVIPGAIVTHPSRNTSFNFAVAWIPFVGSLTAFMACALTVGAFKRFAPLWRIPQPITCESCGYDLSGLTCQRCPECGARTAAANR